MTTRSHCARVAATARRRILAVGFAATTVLLASGAHSKPPSELLLDGDGVAENAPVGTLVGHVSGRGTEDALTFRLVDDGDAPVMLEGGALVTTGPLDYEATPRVRVRIRATDARGAWREQGFDLVVEDLPEAPTDLVLAGASVPESAPIGAEVGQLVATDPDVGDTLTWALVADPDACFTLVEDRLVLARPLDFEGAASHAVTVRVTDAAGQSLEREVSVVVADVNEAPTGTTLSGASVAEDAPVGSVVGTLAAVDPDGGDAATFEVVGPASARFAVDGARILLMEPLDYEAEPSVALTVRVTDRAGLAFEQALAVTVGDRNEAPTAITLSSSVVAENLPAGAPIGGLGVQDEDQAGGASFELVDSAGGRVALVGDQLVTARSLDYEATPELVVVVRAVDAGGLERLATCTIMVEDRPEAPTGIVLSNQRVLAGGAPGRVGRVQVADPDGEVGHAAPTLLVLSGDEPFALSGDAVFTTVVLAPGLYPLTVRAVDDAGLYRDASFTIEAVAPGGGFALAGTEVDEGAAVGVRVGTFTVGGATPAAGTRFELVGDDGTSDFGIAAGGVVVRRAPDFEAGPVAFIVVRMTPPAGAAVVATIPIAIRDVAEAPAAPQLAGRSVAENAAAGSVVGVLTASDDDLGDTQAWSIIDDPAAAFALDGNQLVTARPLDHEAGAVLALGVRVTDGTGRVHDATFAIAVRDVFEVPTTLVLVPAALAENAPAGTVVGQLAVSADGDTSGPWAFGLVDDASGRVAVVGDRLIATGSFDREVDGPEVIVRAEARQGAGVVTAELHLAIGDVDEPAVGFAVVARAFAENAPAGTPVADIVRGADPDVGDEGTLTLGGAGDAGFVLAGDSVVTTRPFDFEAEPHPRLTVVLSDRGGLQLERTVTLAVMPVDEPPLGIRLSRAEVSEQMFVTGTVGRLSVVGDPDTVHAQHLTLTGEGSDVLALDGDRLVVAAPLAPAALRPLLHVTVVATDDQLPPTTLSQAFVIEVTTNAAPVVTPGRIDFGAILEDTTDGRGRSLDELATLLGATDPDGLDVPLGLVLRASIAREAPGRWELSDSAGAIQTLGSDPILVEPAIGTRLRFVPPENVCGFVAGSVQVEAWDGALRSVRARLVDVDVTCVNDPPTVTVPDELVAPEGVTVPLYATIDGVRQPRIRVADVDAVRLAVTLTAVNGTFALTPDPEVKVVTSAGGATIAFRGPIDAVKRQLTNLSFVPAADFAGEATVSVEVSDERSSGQGAVGIANASFPIHVAAVPALAVANGGTALLDGATEALERVPVGAYLNRVYTITNTGGDDLRLSPEHPVFVEGSGLAAWLTVPPPTVIAPGVSVQFVVTLLASEPGPVSFSFDVNPNSPGLQRIQATASGGAVDAPRLALTIDGQVQFGDESIDVGALPAPAGRDVPVTISNDGTAALVVQPAEVLASDNTASLTLDLDAAWLPPAGIAHGTLHWVAHHEGPARANLRFATNDPDQPEVRLEVAGEGVARAATRLRLLRAPRFDAALGTADDLGSLVTGQTTHVVWQVRNDGGRAVALGAPSLANLAGADVVVLSGPLALASGAVGDVVVEVTPRQAAVAFELHLSGPARGASVSWPVTARATQAALPVVTVTRGGTPIAIESWDRIGGVSVGKPTTIVYWLTNVGAAPAYLALPLQLAELVNADGRVLAQPPEILEPGVAVPIPIVLTPTAEGPVSGRIALHDTTTALVHAHTIVSPGAAGTLELVAQDDVLIAPGSAERLPFFLPGTTVVRRYALRNAGTGTVTLANEPTLIGDGAGAAACVGAKMIARWDIEAGARSELEVTLAPGAEPFHCTLTFASNDPLNPSYTVLLLGSARGAPTTEACAGGGAEPGWLAGALALLALRRRRRAGHQNAGPLSRAGTGPAAFAACVVLASVAAGGCGGDDPPATPDTTATDSAHADVPGDVASDSVGPTDVAEVADSTDTTPLDEGWLSVTGNRILTPDGKPFHGRGANLHDTRSCLACAWSEPDPDGVARWSDQLISVWHANFVRFNLSSYAARVDGNQVQWQSLGADAGYFADIQAIVRHMTAKPGVYVMVTLFADPTMKPNNDDYDSEWPTSATLPRYRMLATAFARDSHVLFGLTNEPHGDASHDAELAALYEDAIAVIRAAERAAGGKEHVIVVQAPGDFARDVSYFVAHPLAGTNIAYEIHPYNHAGDFDRLITQPAKKLPLIIGEYGPATIDGKLLMTDADIRALWTTAQAAGVPYIAWNFHMRCPPNLLEDTTSDGCGLSEASGFEFPRTAWGDLLFAHLKLPW